MGKGTCTVPDCGKPVKRIGFCYSHYMKNWRYGTPTPDFAPRWADIRGQRFGTLVVVERANGGWLCRCDCGRERFAAIGELNRTGDAASCGDRPTHRRLDTIVYSSAHSRLRRDRGRVQDHECVNCGSTAAHWSYNHDDPDELYETGISAQPVAFSLKADHYSPRCVSCHKRFDLDRNHATPLSAMSDG